MNEGTPPEDEPEKGTSSGEESQQEASASEQNGTAERSSSGDDASAERLSDRLSTGRLTWVDAEQLAPLFFIVLFATTTAALGYVLHPFISDLVLAFILVGLFRRPFEWLTRRLGGRAWFASGLTTVLILILILGPVIGMGYTVATEAVAAYDRASGSLNERGVALLDTLVDWGRSLGLPLSRSTVVTYVQDMASSLEGLAVSFGEAVIGNALSISIHLATLLIMVFYLLVDGEKLRSFLFVLSPLPDEEDALIVETFRKVSKGVIVGNGLGSAIQGVLGGLAFWAAGLPSPVLWGTVMTLFAFLPLVGISIVVIPATIFLLLQGKIVAGLVFGAFCMAQGLFVENVIKTKMIGSAMRVHDLLVFLSILGGISVFGIIGLVYGPLIAMLFLTLNDLYARVYRPKLAQRLAAR